MKVENRGSSISLRSWVASIFEDIQRAGLIMRKRIFGSENYSVHWGYTDFSGKIILDLGADYGSTASFFLKHGAKKVIAVEGNFVLAEQLCSTFRKSDKVVPIKMWVNSPSQITKLIEKFKPDVVKCDIEGAETNLLQVQLKSADTWLVEAHSNEIYVQLVDKFYREGFIVSRLPCANSMRVIIAQRLKSQPREEGGVNES